MSPSSLKISGRREAAAGTHPQRVAGDGRHDQGKNDERDERDRTGDRQAVMEEALPGQLPIARTSVLSTSSVSSN